MADHSEHDRRDVPPADQQVSGTRTNVMGVGVALGVAIGAALSAALDNVAFVGVGIAIGVSLGAALSHNE